MRHLLFIVAVLAFAVAPAAAQAPPLDTYGGAGGVVGGVDTPADTGAGGVGGIQTPSDAGGNPGGGGGVGGIQDEPGGVQDEPGGGGVGGIVDERGTPGATARGDGAGGSLPFTGLDLALLAVGGIVLLGMGVGMRQLSRSLA